MLTIAMGQGDTDLPHSLVWFLHREDIRKELREVANISEDNSLEIYKGHLLAKCLAYSGSK